jgi:DNA (cytosine-5)-methyltransferase 1
VEALTVEIANIDLRPDEIIVDNFAGGGGASLGIEQALGRSVDIAVNHDPEAVAMHTANHPGTRHYCEDVWKVDPVEAAAGRPVGLAWFSPDCKHFSKAKGGKPVEKKIRGLAWIVIRWARAVRPRVICLENVEEFADWGPLLEDGRPCPLRKGFTFRRWLKQLQNLGYEVDLRELRACDYGAPTIRKRLFIIARCDGRPIRWPEPTHGHGLLPYRTAAECIDWSLPCPSIFERKRPLAEATLKRIARGIRRFVLEAASPFIVPIAHYNGSSPVHSIDEPLRTVTANPKGGHLALALPYFIPRHGERNGQDPRTRSVEQPMPTVTATANGASLVAAFMAQHNTGLVGHDARKPVSTIVGKGCTQALVTGHLLNLKGADRRMRALDQPAPTVCAGGNHASLVAALMAPYYGQGSGTTGRDLREPAPTITTKDRLQLVTTTIDGKSYVLTDIGMRMLEPRELYRAQGFPDRYVINPQVNGKPLTKSAQVRMCGNSVCPPVAAAIVAANFDAEQQEGGFKLA